ncbi:MAG: CRISPR-associated endonuclease Cas2 [Halanaerobiales bacterium]|nr:CRISPR-associated endonuclease Cas2 [Halanaerobiales bacterium]
MHTLVIYDVPDDKIRYKVSELCKDYSLIRIQYSAFLGNLNSNRQQELIMRFRRTLGGEAGNIQLFPICSKDFKLKKVINNGSTG